MLQLTSASEAIADFNTSLSAVPMSVGSFAASAAAIDFSPVLNAASEVDAAIAGIPVAEIAAAVADVELALNGFDISGLASVLSAVGNLTTNLPNVTLISSELDKVNSTLDSLACITTLIDSVVAVNATLVRVPAEADAIVGTLRDTEALMDSVTDVTGSVSAQMANLEAQTAVVAELDIDAMQSHAADIQQSSDSVDLSGFSGQLSSMETALAGARDGAWRASIEDANASLGTTDTSIPDDLCCGGDSILGALPSNLTDAADTIDAFKDAVDDCRFPDDCLTQLVNAGTAADFIAFLGVLRTFLEELSALDAIGTNLQPLIDTAAPDIDEIMSQLDTANATIASAEAGVDDARSELDSISEQLAEGAAVLSELDAQWSSVSATFDDIGPMLDDAVSSVDSAATSFEMLPPDATTQVGELRVMVDEVATMQANFGENVSSARQQIDDVQEEIRRAKHDTVLWKLLHGEQSDAQFPEPIVLSRAINVTLACETTECFTAAV
eukprot:COSAG04_NODE_1166_length_7988_cov_6.987958_11_plen_499_part_01